MPGVAWLDEHALQAQVAHLAYHDALTGLPNRLQLKERLEEALEGAAGTARSVAVLFIDLNDFKLVNDGLGHAAGAASAAYRTDGSDPLRELSLPARMRTALESEQFELHYQPIFRLPERRVVGVEALVRWRDPGHGLIPPGDFIPVAEKTGLIEPLGEWILGEAFRQAREWLAQGLAPRFGINISPRQLRRPGFARALARRVAQTGVDPSHFVLELTESAWTLEAARTGPVLAALRSSGLALAIDDFGAGYSSLGRLRELPVQVIKIDRAFMEGIPEDPQAAAVVAAIFQLAGAYDCDVVAEGVETEGQLQFLAEHGCQLVQGFHLARPMEAPAVTELLRESLVVARRS